MTVIYVPRLIETPEQAEALPVGTVVLSSDHQECAEAADFGPSTPSVRAKRYEPECPYYSEWDGAIPATYVVGGTALVPIEAEEEWAAEFEAGEMCVNLDEESARAANGGTAMSRLVTPWESA